jgi:hypothetical protein
MTIKRQMNAKRAPLRLQPEDKVYVNLKNYKVPGSGYA